jgi:hypothetical protein
MNRTNHLRLCDVKKRVREIFSGRTVIAGQLRWEDPEHSNGLIEDLRRDVLRAIANGSTIARKLANEVVDLPYADYGSEPSTEEKSHEPS